MQLNKIPLELTYILITAIITAMILSFSCMTLNKMVTIKLDTFLIVLGNFGIAYWIASVINKKHKTDELKIHSCFEELNNLEKLISNLRETIKKEKHDDEYINRIKSLINLQIDLVSKYKFIQNEHIIKLKEEYRTLDYMLTGENQIQENYKLSLLSIEKKALVIKSEIL